MRPFHLLMLIALVAAPATARLNLVVFPLVNQDSVAPELSDWASCAVAESFGRSARYVPHVQVWDPAYMFGVDTSGWLLTTDSAILVHQSRWHWDIAVGGAFSTSGDTIRFSLRVARYAGGRLVKRTFDAQGVSVLETVERICVELFGSLGEPATGDELARHARGATNSETAYRTYVAGYRFEMLGQSWAAVSAYQTAIESDPGLGHAAIRMAQLYARGRDPRSADRWARYAIQRTGTDHVLAGLAASYAAARWNAAKAGEVIATFGPVLERSADGYYAAGLYYLQRGEYQRAVAQLTRALAYGPSDLETDLALGRAYQATGDFAMAAEAFNRLASYRPNCGRYYSFLGAAYRNLGYLMESVRVLSMALALENDDVTVMVNLANTYIELGWYQEAERLLTRASALNPLLAEAQVNLAVVYWQSERREQARSILASLRKNTGRSQAVFNNEAVMLAGEQRYHEALDRLRDAEKAGLKNERVIANLAAVTEQAGKLGEAAMWYDELLRLKPDRLDALVARARISVRRGELAPAEAALLKILAIAPHNEDAVSMLADVLVRQGRPSEAVEKLERYLNDFPGDAGARLELATVYLGMQWYPVAAVHFEQVAREIPQRYEAQIGLGEALFGQAQTARGGTVDVERLLAVLLKAQALANAKPEPEYLLGRLYLDYRRDPRLAHEYLSRAYANATDRALRDKIRDAMDRTGQ